MNSDKHMETVPPHLVMKMNEILKDAVRYKYCGDVKNSKELFYISNASFHLESSPVQSLLVNFFLQRNLSVQYQQDIFISRSLF